MDAGTTQELRERIAGYRRLRTATRDKRALAAIDNIIAEAEEHLKHLEAAPPKPSDVKGH